MFNDCSAIIALVFVLMLFNDIALPSPALGSLRIVGDVGGEIT